MERCTHCNTGDSSYVIDLGVDVNETMNYWENDTAPLHYGDQGLHPFMPRFQVTWEAEADTFAGAAADTTADSTTAP